MQWKGSVSSGVFWANVSERYLNVSRICFDHRVLDYFFGPCLFHNFGVEGSLICLERMIAVSFVVVENHRLGVFVEEGSLKGSLTTKAIVSEKGFCGVCRLVDVHLDLEVCRYLHRA